MSRTPRLEESLARWESAPSAERSVELLDAAEAALASDGAAPTLWHRWLDTTRRRDHLLALPGRTARHRWADAAVAAVAVSRYGLAEMLAQRVAAHPGRTLFAAGPTSGGAPLELCPRRPARRRDRRRAPRLRGRAPGGDRLRERLRLRLRRPRLPPARPPRLAPLSAPDPRRADGRLRRPRREPGRRVVGGEPPAPAGIGPAGGAPVPRRPPRRGGRAGRRGRPRPRRGARRPGRRLRPRRAGAGAAARPPRDVHRPLHVGVDRRAEGGRLLDGEPGDEEVRAGRRAPLRRRGGGPPLLPAALPHVRALPRDARDALLGRDVRLRREPVARRARRGAEGGRADGPGLDPDPLGAAGGARPGGRGRDPVGGGRAGGAPDGRRGTASLGALGGRLPRAPGLPLLPGARRRALLGLRNDRGDGRHHDDAAGRVRGGLRRPPAPGHPRPPRRERRAGDCRTLRRALPRRARDRRGRGALVEDGGRLPRAGRRAPRDRRSRQGHLQEQPRPDDRSPPRGAAIRRGAGSAPGLPRGRRKGRQRPPRRPRRRRPRPRGRPAGRGGSRLPSPDRRRGQP